MFADLSPVSCLAVASVADPTGDYHKLHQEIRQEIELCTMVCISQEIMRKFTAFDSLVFHNHVGTGSHDI